MLSKVNLTTLRGLLAARAAELERLMQADPGRADARPGDVTDRTAALRAWFNRLQQWAG